MMGACLRESKLKINDETMMWNMVKCTFLNFNFLNCEVSGSTAVGLY